MSTARTLTILSAMLCLSAAADTFAQSAATTPSARISGVVFDSLARQPLAGAEVQLQKQLASNGSKEAELRSAVTDESGKFSFEGVEDGSYVLGFFHLKADSLGISMPTRMVEVRSSKAVKVDLAIPSHAGLIAIVCGREAVSQSSALLSGFVRDAETLAASDKTSVILQWDELVIGKGGVRGETKQVITQTRSDGWYAFCNVPVENQMQLRVARNADTSGVIAADLIGRQLIRRDLYIGSGKRVARAVSISTDTSEFLSAPQSIWRGNAKLSGRIQSSNGRPLLNAHVSLEGSDTAATTNESGDFVLSGLPSGSQTLSVRALGFLPERRTVHLLTGHAPNEINLSLTSLKFFLDTIRVTTSRVYSSDENGFEGRKRAGQGHYIDRAQIDRQQVTLASDLIRMIPRVEVMSSSAGFFGKVVAFRKPFTFEGYCRPDLYVDGFLFPSGNMEMDEVLNPDQIEGIEVYTKPALAPAQFANNMSGCGSIVVWTRKLRDERQKKK